MIEKIIIISFIVYAIYYSIQEGEIFGRLGIWFENHLPEVIKKPVFGCHICMTPWYGTGLYFLMPFVPEWIPIVIAAMGFNAVMSKMFRED